MTQIALNFSEALIEQPPTLSPLKASVQALALDRQRPSDSCEARSWDPMGFEIGWDYARHRLTPSPDHLHLGHPVRQGWQAGCATFGTRTLRPTRHVAQWLQLRLQAWLRGRVFEAFMVTPRFLAQLDVAQCPVTREGLAGAQEGVIVTLCDRAGVAAGHLAMLGRRAAAALERGSLDRADLHPDLSAEQLCRLQSLRQLVTPMSHAQACASPLTVLPPARVRVLNPVHALQTVLTRLFVGGAYARRMADLGACLPARARRPYALLMSTLLARRLDAGAAADPTQVRHALEDAWAHPLVLRRWAPLAQSLSRADCDRLVQKAVQRGWAGASVRWLDEAQSTEGWSLQTPGPRQDAVTPIASPAPRACEGAYQAQS